MYILIARQRIVSNLKKWNNKCDNNNTSDDSDSEYDNSSEIEKTN